MELTPLRYFIAIAEAGHMTRAAETLGVTQPALSAMLKKLEREVGADLLHRTGRGVAPTDAGLAFLEHAREAVRRADQAVADVREMVGLERGSIRLGGGATATTYLLPPVVSTFRREHPHLRFYIREAGTSAVIDAVRSGELDLGIVTLPLPAAAAGELLSIRLVSDELKLIVPPHHRLADRTSFRWADLAGESMVAFEAGSAVRELIDEASAAAFGDDDPFEVVMELRSIESIKQMVSAGIGVGFVSRFALASDEGLSCRDVRPSRELAIVRRRDRVPSPAAAAFERLLVATLTSPEAQHD